MLMSKLDEFPLAARQRLEIEAPSGDFALRQGTYCCMFQRLR
jgi:hypothetical protein